MLLQECQPRLHYVRMPVLDLNKSPHGNTLKVFLRLLENEVCSWDGPALSYSRKWYGASRGQAHVVCRAHGEVGEQKQVTDRICTELKIADGYSVLWFATEGSEIDGLYVDGVAKGVELFLDLGVERWLIAARDLYASFSKA